jgi:hypothetical protein
MRCHSALFNLDKVGTCDTYGHSVVDELHEGLNVANFGLLQTHNIDILFGVLTDM